MTPSTKSKGENQYMEGLNMKTSFNETPRLRAFDLNIKGEDSQEFLYQDSLANNSDNSAVKDILIDSLDE